MSRTPRFLWPLDRQFTHEPMGHGPLGANEMRFYTCGGCRYTYAAFAPEDVAREHHRSNCPKCGSPKIEGQTLGPVGGYPKG